MQSITLQTDDTIVNSGDLLGQVQFAASAESDGGAARLVAAKIYAQGEGAFGSSSNPTSIIFATAQADSSAAIDRIKIDHNGSILPLSGNAYNIGSHSYPFYYTHTDYSHVHQNVQVGGTGVFFTTLDNTGLYSTSTT